MEDEVKHPLFARFYMRIATSAEDRYRRETLQGLSGQVVEVGAGHGPNFAFYPETVERVLAVEPEPTMRAKAQEAARKAPVPIEVTDGVAARLPVESNAFDAAVACLFLCSVPDQRAALAEFHRVLKPGGELRYYEHVASH
ncbi:MAG TPA: class I SAM-dependent methyltransferase, partial [Solirubrobacterales bacterium]|nr:class I SAM-dependent methyltransferase [Solirubrobacterales bacterium]